jgi:hypothetical protein
MRMNKNAQPVTGMDALTSMDTNWTHAKCAREPAIKNLAVQRAALQWE